MQGTSTAFVPLGVPDPASIDYPAGEPPSEAEVQLGKVLFFEPRLSTHENISCASCHNPDLGFSDGQARGIGTMGNRLGRNTPHIYNLAWNTVFFWDGRAASLEEQALGPIQASGEMNLPLDKAVARLKDIPFYVNAFAAVYAESGITPENIGRAIAAFERTIISANSAFDRYMRGDQNAMSPDAIRGLQLFMGKANCIACHSGPNFTDESFHNIGVGDTDPGRAAVIHDQSLTGAFKTPGLRNVLLSAPYMHDGSVPTLEEVVRFYNAGGKHTAGLSDLMKPLHLNDREIFELVAFLGALTDPVVITRPALPPQKEVTAQKHTSTDVSAD
jgi:cytochrome c peroxidase